MSGWTVRFLGTDMPHEGILQAVEEHCADLLGISTTMLVRVPQVRVAPSRGCSAVRSARRSARRGRRRCSPRPARPAWFRGSRDVVALREQPGQRHLRRCGARLDGDRLDLIDDTQVALEALAGKARGGVFSQESG
jgi:hypothetical protein